MKFNSFMHLHKFISQKGLNLGYAAGTRYNPIMYLYFSYS